MSASSDDDSLGSWKDIENVADLNDLIDAVAEKYPECSRLLQNNDSNLKQSTDDNNVNRTSPICNTVINLSEIEGELLNYFDIPHDPTCIPAEDESQVIPLEEEEETHDKKFENNGRLPVFDDPNDTTWDSCRRYKKKKIMKMINGRLYDLDDPDDPTWIPSEDESDARPMHKSREEMYVLEHSRNAESTIPLPTTPSVNDPRPPQPSPMEVNDPRPPSTPSPTEVNDLPLSLPPTQVIHPERSVIGPQGRSLTFTTLDFKVTR
ncbi:hypothetical protein J6590_096437 [Homalodisca vitripennis]|nr:hypothetical protein J6590_096437 [Homalodisca vitripennis]